MARVFSAVDIEDSEILEELEHVRESIDLGFKPVPVEKMHVTLQFFKDINQDEVEDVVEALKNLSIGPFTVDLKGVGAFPSRDYIRVVWAGVESEKLYELYNQVSCHRIDADNNHDFKPHVTLARVDNVSEDSKKKLRKSLEEFEGHRFGDLEVKSVKLFESKLTGKGACYRLVHEEEL